MPERSSDALETALDRFRQGDLDAFESLFREHQRSVYGWILRIVRDTGAAEDLTVEILPGACIAPMHVSIPRVPSSPGRVASPHASHSTGSAPDRPRANSTNTSLPIFPLRPLPIPASPPRFARKPRRPSPVCRPACASLLFSRVVEEQPHKEVAAALGISVTAVKLRVFRAVRLLRKDLEHQGITP